MSCQPYIMLQQLMIVMMLTSIDTSMLLSR